MSFWDNKKPQAVEWSCGHFILIQLQVWAAVPVVAQWSYRTLEMRLFFGSRVLGLGLLMRATYEKMPESGKITGIRLVQGTRDSNPQPFALEANALPN